MAASVFLIAASFLYRAACDWVAPPMYEKIAPAVARIAVTTASRPAKGPRRRARRVFEFVVVRTVDVEAVL